MQTKEQLDISLTSIVMLGEVMGRIIDTCEGNPLLKKMMKKEFNGLLKQSRKLEKEMRTFIKQDTKVDDPEEMFDTGCDFLYDLIAECQRFTTDEQYIKAISTLKLIR